MTTLQLGLNENALSQMQIMEIEDIVPTARLVITRDRGEMESVLDEVEIAAGNVPHDLILQAPRLRWFQQWGAGADWLLRYPEAVGKDFILTNASGVHALAISEHIIALLLAFARRLPDAVRAQDRREWLSQPIEAVFELDGKAMLLVGVGAIGERTARLAAGLGVRVLGVRRNPQVDAPGVQRMIGPDRLQEFLPEVDFVVLTVPLTRETRGLIGERELRLMKPTAYVVNIGRGGTIDQYALERALRGRWIAGAGLDVFDTEPLPEDSPLWDLDNLIITAHYSGATPEYGQRAMAIFLDNLKCYQAGESLRNVVDKELGY